MNKNYRLLSFRSFFIFFHFYLFSRGLPPAGFFFGWGGEAKNTVLPESFFTFRFFHFFYFTLFHFFTFFTFSDFFTFLHFYNFQIFSLFTFLHFYNFSEVTLPVVYTGSVYFLFFKKGVS